jgi:5-methylcytosine-specific restriction protein A
MSLPLKPCAHPGCSVLVSGSVRRCESHRMQDDRRYNATRPHQRFYNSVGWKAMRAAVRREEPLCRLCKAKGIYRPSQEVDHIIPINQRRDLALVRSNLRALCLPCHNAIRYNPPASDSAEAPEEYRPAIA